MTAEIIPLRPTDADDLLFEPWVLEKDHDRERTIRDLCLAICMATAWLNVVIATAGALAKADDDLPPAA